MALLPWLAEFFPFLSRRIGRGFKASARRRSLQLRVLVLEDRLAPALLTVNSLADGPFSGLTATLTLREAVALVNSGGTATDSSGISLLTAKAGQIDSTNAFGDNDTIQFAPNLLETMPQVIVLQASSLLLSQNVVLAGPGANLLAVSGNNQGPVFEISAASAINLTGLTIESGAANSVNGNTADGGGGIANYGTLTLTNSTVTDNSAANGGGIANMGVLTLTNTTVSNNTADNGAGIVNYGTLTLGNSTVSGNSANFNDGAIANLGTLTLNNSTISGNVAAVGNGGIGSYGGTLTLNDSTVTGNTAAGAGGIGNYSGTMTLDDSTVSGNSATYVGGILNAGTGQLVNSTVSGNSTLQGNGGGIANYDATLTLMDSVVTGNSTTEGNGGGIANSGLLTLTNSTVSGNSTLKGDGGGIVNSGGLTLTNSTVSDNSADNGAGLVNFGTVILGNSRVSGNSATFNDGAIVNLGTLTLNNSTVSGNVAVVGNGGIGSYGGTLTLNDSTVTGNTAAGAGGIGNYSGTMTLDDSTVAGNSATYVGGILNAGTALLNNSTVSGNSTLLGNGGGIANYGGTLTLTDSLVTGNSNSAGIGGGIGNFGTLTLTNSSVQGNSAPIEGDIANAGTLTVIDSTATSNSAVAGNEDVVIRSPQVGSGRVNNNSNAAESEPANFLTPGGFLNKDGSAQLLAMTSGVSTWNGALAFVETEMAPGYLADLSGFPFPSASHSFTAWLESDPIVPITASSAKSPTSSEPGDAGDGTALNPIPENAAAPVSPEHGPGGDKEIPLAAWGSVAEPGQPFSAVDPQAVIGLESFRVNTGNTERTQGPGQWLEPQGFWEENAAPRGFALLVTLVFLAESGSIGQFGATERDSQKRNRPLKAGLPFSK